MGLLDGLFNLKPEQNQGLLAAAAHMLQASGPSRVPVSFGQIVGGGILAGQQAFQQAREQHQQQELYDLKLKDAKSDFAYQELERDRKKRIASKVGGLKTGGGLLDGLDGGQPSGLLSGLKLPAADSAVEPMASAFPGGPNSPKIGGPAWLQAYQLGKLGGSTNPTMGGGLMNPDGLTPASHMDGGVFYRAAEGNGLPTDIGTLNQIVRLVNQGHSPQQAAASLTGRSGANPQPPAPSPGQPQPGSRGRPGNRTDAYVQRLFDEADIYASEGDFEGANKRYESAIKFMPQVDRIETALDRSSGQPVRVITYKDGREEISAFGAKPDMKEISLGDKKVFRDINTVKNGETFQMGYSPSDRVSMRNQNMADERQREANNIAAGQKVITASSGLRQEFDGLPEVKTYKQALPVYTTIKDAVTRNTTQSDINIVYGIAKLYDPTSVVREGEYATVANSPNIPERIKGLAQYLAGGGRLTDQVKKELLAEASSRMRSYEQPFLEARQNYTTISRNSGADPGLLFPSEYQSPIPNQGGGKVATLADIAATAKASGKSTAQVTADLRAKGYTIRGQ